jgi:dTDP-4-amino-4,6-dideoxygalactose transaminase
MLSLLPAELWDYHLTDALGGLRVTVTSRTRPEEIVLGDVGSCIPARSARAAIVTAIESLDLPKQARIGVPLYCCPVVFKAIAMAGCVPRFIDVDRSSYCVSIEDAAVKRSEIDALIAVHMFGNLCDVPRLREAIGGKPIIEDCALSLGSKLNGRPTGSMGDVGVFSFRSGKYLSVGEGGALYAADSALRERLDETISRLPTPTWSNEVVHVAKTWLRSALRSRPLYGLVGHALWEKYNQRAEYSDKSPISLTQGFRTDLHLADQRLGNLGSIIERQRKHAGHYDSSLKLGASMLCREESGMFFNRYQYPIAFAEPEQRDAVARFLLEKQVDSSKPLNEVVDVATRYYGYRHDCPISENLSKRTLVVPNYHSMTDEEVEFVAQCVNEGTLRIGNRVTSAAGKLVEVRTG